MIHFTSLTGKLANTHHAPTNELGPLGNTREDKDSTVFKKFYVLKRQDIKTNTNKNTK